MNPRGLVNLRDLGGLPVCDGRRTRSGVLYRSDAPYVGDAAPRHVAWPPALVLDLRSESETRVRPCSWPTGTSVLRRPIHEGGRPDRLTGWGDLTDLYATILDRASDRIAAVLADVAIATGPTLVHCAAGKDRTGIVVAALLLAAKVEPDAVIADYAASGPNMPSLQDRWEVMGIRRRGGRDVPDRWLESPEGAITSVVERITNWPGGARGWWLSHGASRHDLQAWVARICAPAG